MNPRGTLRYGGAVVVSYDVKRQCRKRECFTCALHVDLWFRRNCIRSSLWDSEDKVIRDARSVLKSPVERSACKGNEQDGVL
jgi:hypothetical protein